MIIPFALFFILVFGMLAIRALELSRGFRMFCSEQRGQFDGIVCSMYSRVRPYGEIFSKNTFRFVSKIVLAFLVKMYFATKKWFVTKEEAFVAFLHKHALRTRRGSLSFVVKSVSDHRNGVL